MTELGIVDMLNTLKLDNSKTWDEKLMVLDAFKRGVEAHAESLSAKKGAALIKRFESQQEALWGDDPARTAEHTETVKLVQNSEDAFLDKMLSTGPAVPEGITTGAGEQNSNVEKAHNPKIVQTGQKTVGDSFIDAKTQPKTTPKSTELENTTTRVVVPARSD